MKKQIVILGSMDTKSEVFGFVKKQIEQTGLNTLLIDVGVIDPPGLKPDVTRHEVAKAAGKDLDTLIKDGPSREAVAPVMTEGVKNIGLTNQGAMKAKEIFEKSGYEIIVFHACGPGGPTMESLIRENLIDGVFDLVTIEVMQEMFDGLLFKKSDRMTAAAEMGVPQIMCPGGIDNIFGPRDIIVKHFSGRPAA